MKRKTLIALLACIALAATGCGSKEKETEAPVTEAVTTEAATTEAETEEVTTEAATTEAATEVETETETEEVTTEEATTEAATTEVETETETEEVTTEEATTEAATEVETETETEEVTTEAATTEAATEVETETETEEVTTEAATTEVETETETEEATTEAESESETETEIFFDDLPAYVASDYVTLGEYKGLTVEVAPIEVSEEEVNAEVEYRTITVVTEGTVEEGDVANIDYEGKKDGVAFEGGTAAGYDLEIGSGMFIEGFEEGLVGVAIGETVDLNLTFPEEYHSADLAGQEVVFTVTVNSVQRVPELTDEVAAAIVLEDGTTGLTAEEYRASVRTELEENAAEEMKYNAQYALLSQVIANATINGYPEEALTYNKWKVTTYYEMIAAMSGLTLEELLGYYGMDMASFEEMVTFSAEEGLAQALVLTAVAEAEGMEVTDEMYEEGLVRYTKIQGFETSEDLIAEFGENYIKNSLLQEMALEFLYENAIITEPVEEAVTEAAVEEETEKATEAVEEETTETETVEVETEEATEVVTEEVTAVEEATEVVTEETTTEAATEEVTEEVTEAESESTAESETETEA